uniref:phosphoglycerate kinase-like n=1 Tax=Styela clava TaxID=7725 RepID=UPI001939F24C|nr:phosphoglycerate kinase-like [Styela clava]
MFFTSQDHYGNNVVISNDIYLDELKKQGGEIIDVSGKKEIVGLDMFNQILDILRNGIIDKSDDYYPFEFEEIVLAREEKRHSLESFGPLFIDSEPDYIDKNVLTIERFNGKSVDNDGQYFVYEAFATSHRKHASTYGVLDYFDPSKIALGFLAYDEINLFFKFLKKPLKPFSLIMGGGKPESKLPLIGKLLKDVDRIIVCGALAYTFLKAKGYQVGNNPVDNNSLEKVKQ